jgi:hypothetical protein
MIAKNSPNFNQFKTDVANHYTKNIFIIKKYNEIRMKHSDRLCQLIYKIFLLEKELAQPIVTHELLLDKAELEKQAEIMTEASEVLLSVKQILLSGWKGILKLKFLLEQLEDGNDIGAELD